LGSATVSVAAFGVSPNASPLSASQWQKSVFIRLSAEALAKADVHPWLKNFFAKQTHSGNPQVIIHQQQISKNEIPHCKKQILGGVCLN
jgi:hypothetical protein